MATDIEMPCVFETCVCLVGSSEHLKDRLLKRLLGHHMIRCCCSYGGAIIITSIIWFSVSITTMSCMFTVTSTNTINMA